MKSSFRSCGFAAVTLVAATLTLAPWASAQEDRECRPKAVITRPNPESKQVSLPVLGSSYVSPRDFHAYLAAGGVITAELRAKHGRFLNRQQTSGVGLFAGNVERFTSIVRFEVGDLGSVDVQADCETHTSAQDPSAQIQTLETAMYSLKGEAKANELFDKFQVVAGEAYELPSPGTTTLTQLPDGTVQVDSSFQIRFRAEWTGKGGGPLDGQEGVTEGVISMSAVGEDLP